MKNALLALGAAAALGCRVPVEGDDSGDTAVDSRCKAAREDLVAASYAIGVVTPSDDPAELSPDLVLRWRPENGSDGAVLEVVPDPVDEALLNELGISQAQFSGLVESSLNQWSAALNNSGIEGTTLPEVLFGEGTSADTGANSATQIRVSVVGTFPNATDVFSRQDGWTYVQDADGEGAVRAQSVLHAGYDCSTGQAYIDGAHIYILVSTLEIYQDYPGVIKFVIAHELGHALYALGHPGESHNSGEKGRLRVMAPSFSSDDIEGDRVSPTPTPADTQGVACTSSGETDFPQNCAEVLESLD